MNESPKTRQQWVKKRNMGWVIQEDVEHLLLYFDHSKQKVLDLMLIKVLYNHRQYPGIIIIF